MDQPPIRATITILLSAGASPPAGAGMVGLEAVPSPPSGSELSSLPPNPPSAWGTPSNLSAKALQAVPGPQSAGTVVIIAILSVLLAVLFTALLALLIYTW